MPFVQVFTRESLSQEVRAKLAENLSNTLMTVELGRAPMPRLSTPTGGPAR